MSIFNLFILCKWRPCCQKHLLVLHVSTQIFILCSQKCAYAGLFIAVCLARLPGGIDNVWQCLLTNLVQKYSYNLDCLVQEYFVALRNHCPAVCQLRRLFYICSFQNELMHLSDRWAILWNLYVAECFNRSIMHSLFFKCYWFVKKELVSCI